MRIVRTAARIANALASALEGAVIGGTVGGVGGYAFGTFLGSMNRLESRYGDKPSWTEVHDVGVEVAKGVAPPCAAVGGLVGLMIGVSSSSDGSEEVEEVEIPDEVGEHGLYYKGQYWMSLDGLEVIELEDQPTPTPQVCTADYGSCSAYQG